MNINNGFNDIPQSKCDENIYKKDKYPIIYKQISIQLYTKRQVSNYIQTDKYPIIYKTDKYPNI